MIDFETNEGLGRILVRSKPTGAKIIVDDAFKSYTNDDALVPTGIHELRIEKEGYRTVVMNFVISYRGEILDFGTIDLTTSTDATLEPRYIPDYALFLQTQALPSPTITAPTPTVFDEPTQPSVMADDVGISYSVVGDEITITASIRNNSVVTREYRLFIYNASGHLLEKEPDFSWKNAKPNETISISATSRYDASWDVKSVYPMFRATVVTQDKIVVADKIIDLTSGDISNSPDVQESDLTTTDTMPPITQTPIGDVSGKPISVRDGTTSFFQNIQPIMWAMVGIAIIGALKK